MLAALLAIAEESGSPESRFLLPKTDELIFASIAFLILVIFVYKKIFPMMGKAMAARTEKIKGSIDAAEKAKADADAMMAQYRQQLAETRGDANKIIEEAKRTADALRADLVARAEAEAREIVQRASAEIGGERERALAELRTTIGELSITLATKVIERELTNETAQRAYVDQTIAELTSLGNGSSR